MNTTLIHNIGERRLGNYAALYNDGAFYVFGGSVSSAQHPGKKLDTIGRLDTKTYAWSKVGCQLETKRKMILKI